MSGEAGPEVDPTGATPEGTVDPTGATPEGTVDPTGATPEGTVDPTAGPIPDVPAGAGVGAAPAARRRAWPWAAARALAVLAVAGVGYAVVVPTSPLQRSRLGLLVDRSSGLPAYPGPPARAAEQPVAASGLSALVAAARHHADQVGVWIQAWQGSARTGSAAVAFLTPTPADAVRVRPQLAGVSIGAGAYRAEGLVQAATWSVPGVPGSAGATYRSTGTTAAGQSVGVALWTSGRALELVEVAQPGDPRPAVSTAARHQAAHLAATVPGFTLAPTRYPPLATGLWAAGTALVALAVGPGPVLARRRRERRAADEAAAAARTIRVGSQVIVRNRRGA